MPKGNGMVFRCRACGKEFRTKPTPHKFVLVKCPDPKCDSDDIEFISA